jgi:TolA-binding protein
MRVLARASAAWFLALAVILCAATASAQEKPEAATRQYNAAVALQNRGVYDLAIDEWVKFINTHKADARMDRAFHYLGVCYLQTNNLDQALQCFETVVKTYPKCELMETTQLCLGATQLKLAQGGKKELFDAAGATFDQLLRTYPNGKHVPQALFNRGDCYYHAGKKAEAAQVYAQVLTKSPDDKLLAEVLYALGVTQEELNRAAEAGKSYDDFLKKFPEHNLAGEVVMRRGETLFATGQHDAAAQWFASAAARPKFAMADYATLRQAAALAQLKKYAEAAEIYATFSKKFPNSQQLAAASNASHALARSLLKENKPADALAVVEKALPNAGNQAPQLLMDQADATYEIPEKRAEAVKLYTALATRYPREPIAAQALYMSAYAALALADHATAARQADAFLAAHPTHELAPDVTYVSAESRLQLGRYGEAEQLYAQLAEKHPQHADADFWKVRRGNALQLQKKFQETINLLQPLLAQIKNPEALAEAHYLIGSAHVEREQYAEAAKSLEAALAAQPKGRQADEALLALAHAQQRQGEVDKARQTLRRLLAELPNSKTLDRAHYRLGEYSAGAKDPKTAAAEYQQVLQKWPQSVLAPFALYGLGWAQFDQNDFAAAEKTFDAMLQQHAGHKLAVRSRYARGMARQQLGKFAEAVPDIEALLSAEPAAPEKSDARYVLGLCQVGLKKFAEAAAAFQALLRDDPKYAASDKVLYELAWSLKSLNRDKEAAEAFARLATERPDSSLVGESNFHVAEAAYKEGKFTEAAVAYRSAMDKAGKTELGEKAAHKLGWAFYRLDNAADALQTFAYQRAMWPNGPLSADAAFMEAECLFRQKKFKEALAAYKAVKPPLNKDFQALAGLHSAEAAGQLKQWDESQSLIGNWLKAFPDSPYLPEALYIQGWTLQNQGKTDEALAVYEQVIAKSNGEAAARAQFMIGEVQFQQKKHTDAIKSFFKVAYTYAYPQWQADASYEAARCFEVLGKKSQAAKMYQELADKYPQSDKTPLAKERVKSLQE